MIQSRNCMGSRFVSATSAQKCILTIPCLDMVPRPLFILIQTHTIYFFTPMYPHSLVPPLFVWHRLLIRIGGWRTLIQRKPKSLWMPRMPSPHLTWRGVRYGMPSKTSWRASGTTPSTPAPSDVAQDISSSWTLAYKTRGRCLCIWITDELQWCQFLKWYLYFFICLQNDSVNI